MDYFPMRKEFPLEDQTRKDKDDEMFGRGGTLVWNVKTEMNILLQNQKKIMWRKMIKHC